MATSADYLSTGGGKLYIKPIILGVKQDMVYFGATDTVTLTTEVEYIEHKSTEYDTAVTDKKISKSRKAVLNFTTGEISPAILAKAFLGVEAEKTQAAGTAVAQTISGVKFGVIYDLGIVKITSFVVKDSVGTITYVEGVDYSIDKNSGFMEILSTGSIAELDNINLTIDNDVYSYVNVASLKGEQLEGELIFISDPQSGQKYKYVFHKVSISSSGDFALKSEEFSTLSFEGEALIDDSVTDPTLSNYFDIVELPND